MKKNESATVLEMVEEVIDDKEFHGELQNELSGKSFAKALFAMRCSRGLTQSEVAERLDCKQSKVSKMENAHDKDMKVGDLMSYAAALDLKLSVTFHEPMTHVDAIKVYAVKIAKSLEALRQIAGSDCEMVQSVGDFHVEALFNFARFICQSAEKLPDTQVENGRILRVDYFDEADESRELQEC